MNAEQVTAKLRSLANPLNIEGMARFEINPRNTLGVSIPETRKLAKQAGKNHELAQELWKTGVHEARIMAALVDEPAKVTERQMDSWAKDFDSWDVCDEVCMNLFDKTPFAYEKAVEWSSRKEEFVKRAGFALMACLAIHDKTADDKQFLAFLSAIKRVATDDRNFVKKAVNWALRQIGKRNKRLNAAALKTAKEIQALDCKAAKWIAADAIKELESTTLKRKLNAG